MGGTGPRSGSTGNSTGLGALSPGSSGPSSEGWGRWEAAMQNLERHRQQNFQRKFSACKSSHGRNATQHCRDIGCKRTRQPGLILPRLGMSSVVGMEDGEHASMMRPHWANTIGQACIGMSAAADKFRPQGLEAPWTGLQALIPRTLEYAVSCSASGSRKVQTAGTADARPRDRPSRHHRRSARPAAPARLRKPAPLSTARW